MLESLLSHPMIFKSKIHFGVCNACNSHNLQSLLQEAHRAPQCIQASSPSRSARITHNHSKGTGTGKSQLMASSHASLCNQSLPSNRLTSHQPPRNLLQLESRTTMMRIALLSNSSLTNRTLTLELRRHSKAAPRKWKRLRLNLQPQEGSTLWASRASLHPPKFRVSS